MERKMIKLSLQSLSYRDTFNAGEIDLIGIIEKAYQLKLDGIDIHNTHFESTDKKYLEQIRNICHKKGLQICYIGVSNNFGLSGSELKFQIEQMKHWIDIAANMGVRMVRAFGAWIPNGQNEKFKLKEPSQLTVKIRCFQILGKTLHVDANDHSTR